MSAVRDTDHGYRALVDRLFKFGKPVVEVGILEADGTQDHDGLTVASLAAIHEFGLGVPERSFLRAWFDENQERALEAMRRLFVSVVEGKRTKEQALELFGQWVQGEIQKRIAAGIPPANAASTIERKGSSTPLINAGQLRASISYAIDYGDGRVKHGTSEAAVARHAAEKTAKRQVKVDARKKATERRREKRAAKTSLKKDIKAAKRALEKTIRGVKKDALKGAKRATKKTSKAAKRLGRRVRKAIG